MSAFPRASVALGLAASLLAATSVLALDATEKVAVNADPSAAAAAPETQQAVALVSNGVAARAANDPGCPTVTVAPEGDSRNADGAKATLDGLARDCANLGAETIVKVAMVGEGERKKDKGASAFDAPMTISVRDGQGRDIETRRINLKVEMPDGVQRVSFRHVEENVSLPPPSADGYANWTIVVGLDPSTEAEQEVVAEAEAEEAVEKPRKGVRSAKSRKSRYSRTRATRRAREVATRRPALPAPDPNAVVVTAKPIAQPVQIVTTTTSGSAMAKAAASFTERRDKAAQDKRARDQQQARAGRQQPQPAARSAPGQRQVSNQPRQSQTAFATN